MSLDFKRTIYFVIMTIFSSETLVYMLGFLFFVGEGAGRDLFVPFDDSLACISWVLAFTFLSAMFFLLRCLYLKHIFPVSKKKKNSFCVLLIDFLVNVPEFHKTCLFFS